MEYRWNEYQTSPEDLHLERYPDEVQEQFHDFMATVPYLQYLASADRPRARDLPRDERGRIIVDIAHPHILEDMDYFRPAALHYQQTGRYCDYVPNANPNSPFMKWLIEETRRCWYGYVRESDGEWIPGDLYFLWNYCPINLTEKEEGKKRARRVIGFPRVWEGHYLKFHYAEQARNNAHHGAELASRGKGKAHPYSQIVETPEGRKLWGDIRKGDILYTPSGGTTRVTDIPFDEEADIYDIVLADGRVIQASSGHLFAVRDVRKKLENQQKVMSVQQMLDEGYYVDRKDGLRETYISIRRNERVEFERKEVKIDPYTLGLLIGDGGLTNCTPNTANFTSRDEDMDTYRRYVPYVMDKKKSKYGYILRMQGIKNILSYYGLDGKPSWDKHIPDDYKYNTSEVRLEILRGILDTDGTVNNNGVPMLTTTSEQLCKDVMWICRSLGYNCTMFKKQGKYNGKICRMAYNITIMTNDPVFKLERKLVKMNAFNSSYHKARRDWVHIKEIRYSHREMAKCVTVDSPDHCYLIGEFVPTHNSLSASALLAKRFIMGEDEEVNQKVVSYITASEKKYLVQNGDQTLDKFEFIINFLAQRTELQWPKQRITSTLQNMQWQMGYRDVSTGTKMGTQNSVIGVSAKDDESKLRGTRGVLYILEEFGSFPRLSELHNNMRFSVEEGELVYGLIYAQGTAGDSESDFQSAQEMVYNPRGYNLQTVPNVYDKKGQGRPEFTYFFPGYLNRAECYNKDGVSDVTKALLEILMDRYNVKYHSTKLSTITRRIAEYPVTPQEAMLKTARNMFPVAELNERLNQLLSDLHAMDNTYIGTLAMDSSGEVSFTPTSDTPITEFPLQDNKEAGALQIFLMPEKNSQGKVFPERYILGVDPADNDEANTLSLYSIFVLDLWTDQIAAEYTGRYPLADDCHEMVRKLCLFYNAKALYEAHPYDQKVIMADGTVKEWGDVHVGDLLLSLNGEPTKVVNIPIDGEDDIYRFTLSDGRTVESSRSHKWKVQTIRKEWKELTTEEIINEGVYNKHGQHNFFIPESGGVDFPEREVPIDPYTLGLLIAEGAFTKFRKSKYENFKRNTVQISSSKEDMEFYKTVIPYSVKYIGTKGYSWHLYIDDIDKKLDNLGLLHHNSHNKFIPELYLYNSRKVRLELLKGLMDGDGCANRRGASVFITTSRRLADDVMLLARSLGFKAFENKGKQSSTMTIDNIRVYNTVESFRVAIASEEKIFKLPRKIEKQHVYRPYVTGSKASAILYKTAISKIEYVGKKRCKCVTVDRPDGLYLIGDYIVTHNCNIKGLYAYFKRMQCTHLLADTPEYLKDKDIIKTIGSGNSGKGVMATASVNNYANSLIRDWLIKPVPIVEEDENGEPHERSISNLYRIKNIALIRELIAFNPEINVDRIRALGEVMLYREEKMILYGGNPQSAKQEIEEGYLGNDPFFKNNYDDRMMKFSKN